MGRVDFADRRGLRVGVGDARHGLVVRPARIAGEVRRDHIPFVFADVGQGPDAVDVADRPEALPRAHVLVDLDSPGVGFNTDCFQTDPLDTRTPAGRYEQAVAPDLATAVELQHILVALPSGGTCVHPQGQ